MQEVDEIREWWEAREGEGSEWYQKAYNHLKSIGITHVYDIGCSYGPYIGMALDMGLNYIGIDERESVDMHNSKDTIMDYNVELRLNTKFPCVINPQTNSAALSMFALGSLFQQDQIPEAMIQLKKEFKHFYVATFREAAYIMREYWDHAEWLPFDDFSNVVWHFWDD